MKTFALAASASALLAASAAQAADREVTIDGGKAPLHGSLTHPDGGLKSSAAVLIISGSGPTDRNSDSTVPGVKPATLRLLAEGLAQQGVASLRFDKRGIAASAAAGGSEKDLRFNTFVDDAVAWGRFLATQPGVRCIVIAGHSEGSLIGMLAAQQIPVCGFISIAGAGRPIAVVLREQLAAQLPAETLKQVDAVLAELSGGREVPAVPATDPLFRPSVQPYLISWLPLDPAQEIKKVKAPVLILQGERDIQVSMDDAKALAAARPNDRFLVLPGVNHVLKDAPADRAGNIATYADPALPLDPHVTEAIVSFTKAAAPR
jgi:hypothetical protein